MNINDISYIYVEEDEKLLEAIKLMESCKILGVDTETTGLEPQNNSIRLLQVATEGNPVVIIDINKLSKESLEKLKTIFDSGSVKVFQNAKFDLKFLIYNGFKISGPIFDTMLAAQVIGDRQLRSYSLESLAYYYLNIKLIKEEQKSDWSQSLTGSQLAYAAKDAAILLPLRERLIKSIKEFNLIEACKIEFDCAFAVVDMELSGVKLNVDKWNKLYKSYSDQQRELTAKLYKELGGGGMQTNLFGEEAGVGINLDSQSQVIKALKGIGIELQTTSHADLIEYKDKYEVVNHLLEYRRLSKAIQSFLYPIPQYINQVTGRLHSSYRQIGASSGRFSCSNPNIQQIPRGKEFRECFVPEKGNKFVMADYSQIELRVAAEIAMDSTMIEAYRSGQDLHALTASLIANKSLSKVTKMERQSAKAVNFGLIYAMGAKGLQGYAKTVYGVDMSLEEAEIFRDRFFKAYKGIANWHAKMKKAVNVTETRTLGGRRCTFGTEAGITALLNTPVQGTAADIAKKALGMLVPVVKELSGSIIATVHDEILLEVPSERAEEAAVKLKDIMEKAGAYYLKQVPVVAETIIANSWAEK
jgi:DNA polymerase I-like protein with 3'-5' exonuclease and polymerase domains